MSELASEPVTIAGGRSVLLAHGSAELYGSDRMVVESVAAMVDAGWRVVVTVPGEGPLLPAVRAAGARVARCPVPVLRKAALRPAGLARLALDAARAVRPMLRLLRAERPDLIYVNTVTVPLWLPLARARRVPVLAHVHEAEEAVPAVVRVGLAAPLLAAGRVLVNSAATEATLARALPPLRGRVRRIDNGVAGPARPLGPAATPREPARVLLVGRLSPRKGVDVAVDAVALLRRAGRNVRLDVLGSVFPGYEWYERAVRDRITAAGLADAVRLRGFSADVWPAYADADLAVVPSRVEPFGNTAVEAQLAGVPVVVSDAQGLPETVGHGRHGLVVAAGDPAALAGGIAAVLDDWPVARERALAARAAAAERFAPRRYRQRVAAAVEELAGSRPAPQ
ncbi:hypothetical protein SAMN05421810_108279 [Amycolatopsis arida]|uniref:Uncharacterized protein n=1 Tax=Amycolatopsis arida TaxID=587909 RepID=A0A1I5Z6Y7_9PSEU|nr:glycosyltransferase family 4 protein [Amycolatopsis arida]TDX90190.1 hypothetical protein CLV69_108279 [Amycolatopsis arida]SFQ52228.1 hypothetical protein SAMN05421810_108279 [Amycolatopsis arida]